MKIAIASGKGGSGKTSFSILLAHYLAQSQGEHIKFLDCDCEAPNAHIFFDLELVPCQTVHVVTPSIDESKCTFCGKCREICRFNAITLIGDKVAMTFPELCHGCRGCFRVCESGAILENPREIGRVFRSRGQGPHSIELIQGRLRIGEAMSPPLIRAVLAEGAHPNGGISVIDCPPGTSCPVVTSMRGADLVVVVAEPTPFGLHDAEILVRVVRKMEIPFLVVGNKVFSTDDLLADWCRHQRLPYIGGIPFLAEFSRTYASGGDIFHVAQKYGDIQEVLCKTVEALTKK